VFITVGALTAGNKVASVFSTNPVEPKDWKFALNTTLVTGAVELEELLEDELAGVLELDTSELELGATELEDTLELDATELAELELITTLDDELLLDDTGAEELELEPVITLIQSVVSLGSGFHPAPLLKPAKICARLQKVFCISPKDNWKPN